MKLREPTIGPWMKGMDSYHSSTPSNKVYTGGRDLPPSLLSAVNVDIDNYGCVRRRKGIVDKGTLTNAVNIYKALQSGRVLLQDGDSINLVTVDGSNNYTISTLYSGLGSSDFVDFYELGFNIYYTNGTVCGKINSSSAHSHWGMTVPPAPVLSDTSGSLAAGRYLVACNLLDSDGEESGTSENALIELASTGAITVDLSSVDSNAVSVKIYASNTNQPELNWCKTVAVGSLPTTLSDVEVSTIPPYTKDLRNPIPSDGIFSYMSWLLLYRDKVLFRSSGTSHHLFRTGKHVRVFPSDILGGGGTKGGFWITTAQGAWFTSGDDPKKWAPLKKDTRAYAAGQLVVDGSIIPELQTNELIVLFVSENGLMAGLPNGVMVGLTESRLSLDVSGKRAYIATHTEGNIERIIFNLQ